MTIKKKEKKEEENRTQRKAVVLRICLNLNRLNRDVTNQDVTEMLATFSLQQLKHDN